MSFFESVSVNVFLPYAMFSKSFVSCSPASFSSFPVWSSGSGSPIVFLSPWLSPWFPWLFPSLLVLSSPLFSEHEKIFLPFLSCPHFTKSMKFFFVRSPWALPSSRSPWALPSSLLEYCVCLYVVNMDLYILAFAFLTLSSKSFNPFACLISDFVNSVNPIASLTHLECI